MKNCRQRASRLARAIKRSRVEAEDLFHVARIGQLRGAD
jgi:hypothetical protein